MANKIFNNKGEQNVVKMSELLDQCNKFLDGKITHEELIQWSEKVQFFPFLPIREKMFNIMYVLMDCVYSSDLTERFITLEMNKFWYLLIPYTNIELDDALMTEDNFDIIYAMCYSWIYDRVKSDYDICLSLFNTVMNILKQEDLAKTFEDLADTNFGDMIKSNNELVDNLSKNKDTIRDLANIMIYNNGDFSKLKDNLSRQIKDEVIEKKEKE